jgi:hypothetical protein
MAREETEDAWGIMQEGAQGEKTGGGLTGGSGRNQNCHHMSLGAVNQRKASQLVSGRSPLQAR